MRDGIFRIVEVNFPFTILGSPALPPWSELRRHYLMNFDVGPIWNLIDDSDAGARHIIVPLEAVKLVCPSAAYRVRHVVINAAGGVTPAEVSYLVRRDHLEYVLSGAFTIDLDSPAVSMPNYLLVVAI